MAGEGKQRYKRSWKNLLINKDYQLKMTLVLVGISGLLVAGLGWWVMTQARTATEVAINNVEGTRCEVPPWLADGEQTRVIVDEITDIKTKQPEPPAPEPTDAPAVADDAGAPAGETKDEGADAKGGSTKEEEAAKEGSDSPTPEPPETEAAASADDNDKAADAPGPAGGATADARERGSVSITDSSMELTDDSGEEELAAGAAAALDEVDADERAAVEQRYHDCELGKRARIDELHKGEKLIFQVLVALGALLVFGLAAYGIKMTHRVAGPLFKVTTYLRKLRDGSYGEVYNLRKGDRLVDFYGHFKAAYAGVRKLQDEDIAQLREVVEAAKAAGLANKSPEVAEALAELEGVLAEKEKSIG